MILGAQISSASTYGQAAAGRSESAAGAARGERDHGCRLRQIVPTWRPQHVAGAARLHGTPRWPGDLQDRTEPRSGVLQLLDRSVRAELAAGRIVLGDSGRALSMSSRALSDLSQRHPQDDRIVVEAPPWRNSGRLAKSLRLLEQEGKVPFAGRLRPAKSLGTPAARTANPGSSSLVSALPASAEDQQAADTQEHCGGEQEAPAVGPGEGQGR